MVDNDDGIISIEQGKEVHTGRRGTTVYLRLLDEGGPFYADPEMTEGLRVNPFVRCNSSASSPRIE